MKQIQQNGLILTILASFILGFTGCASTYDIKPSYDKKFQLLKIDTLEFKNVYNHRKNSGVRTSNMDVRDESATYTMSNKDCSDIHYSINSASGNTYMIDGFHYENCINEDIGNLRFSRCNNNNYIRNLGMIKGSGYASIETLKVDYKCYVKIMNHFNSKSENPKKLQELEEPKTIFIKIKSDEEIKWGGKPVFTAKTGDLLTVVKVKNCRFDRSKICWKVKDSKSGKVGFVYSGKMYDYHKVYKK